MRSVTCGRSALDGRRKSAYDRLEKHLSNHRKAHEDLSDEEFKSHETLQKAEFAHVSSIMTGDNS